MWKSQEHDHCLPFLQGNTLFTCVVAKVELYFFKHQTMKSLGTGTVSCHFWSLMWVVISECLLLKWGKIAKTGIGWSSPQQSGRLSVMFLLQEGYISLVRGVLPTCAERQRTVSSQAPALPKPEVMLVTTHMTTWWQQRTGDSLFLFSNQPQTWDLRPVGDV